MTVGTDEKQSIPAPYILLALPDWVERIVEAGIVSADPHVRRRQRFANVASYALSIDALTHLIVNSAHNFEALLPVNIYNFLACIVYLLLHRLHRVGDTFMVNVLIAFALIGHSYVIFAFGLASNLQVYFTMAGIILFLVGLPHWRNFLVLYLMTFAALMISMTFATEEGFVMLEDQAFRESLGLQAMVSAFVLNAVVIAAVLAALDRAEQNLQFEYDRAENLLESILPASIAKRLKSGKEKQIADRLEGASVLFMDLVGFTPVSGSAAPEDVVDYLHRLFSRFDDLCETYGVDKIKTIGDSYMAVGGLDGDEKKGAGSIARLALAMRNSVGSEELAGEKMGMRAGIHFGPVVAGVIGDRRLAYDVWGATVNIASRMESSGKPGEIHVTDDFKQVVGDEFSFEPLGVTELKGAGPHKTYFLREKIDADQKS
ncbi:MAG: adenylate/guanylate cyclase domain-containing protein [Pseudomonadota bacterium]